MRISLCFVCLIFLSVVTTSCSFEKRLYRNGWYTPSEGKTGTVNRSIPDQPKTIDGQNRLLLNSAALNASSPEQGITSSTSSAEIIPGKAASFFAQHDTSVAKRGMAYPDAVASIHKQGGTIDPFAKKVHLFEILSYVTILFPPLMILMILTTIILSYVAENKIRKKGGNFVAENLAIVKHSRRNEFTFLIVIGSVVLVLFGVLFYLTFYTHAFV